MRVVLVLILIHVLFNETHAQVWNPDLGDGTYQNPIIYADYSDPDVVRVGEDFYMVSSSFNCAPGLPVLHSTDLVNWEIVNYVMPKVPPFDVFDKPQHGNGIWAPSIRFHDGWYYVFYGDPDFGIYMIKTQDPEGAWEKPHLVHSAKGWIDACPFWDEDGNAYLVHAFAGSRAGIKTILVLHRMAADGSRLLDDGVLVFDGHEGHGTIEGPKMYKRNGYYYIFAPAGGVATGWQTVLRSKNVFGPYEEKIVLAQGDTDINGPHQGAWIDTGTGEDWFIHFQEKQPYGRIVHLQPAVWKDDWIIIGEDADGDGTGEPVARHKMPKVKKKSANKIPQTSDEMEEIELGLQWQWHANPEPTWGYNTPYGYMRIYTQIRPDLQESLWSAPNLLMQKFPAPAFTATAKVDFQHHYDGERVGLVVMGRDYSYLGMKQIAGRLFLYQAVCPDADKGGTQSSVDMIPLSQGQVYLRVNVAEGGLCTFAYSLDGRSFTDFGEPFQAREGKWIGAKFGFFGLRDAHESDGGYVDIDWMRITELKD
ncbi:MAG: glycosyl hydrolase 43 family protein [Bacteroidetes bacterium]|nr:glycosyl hydrolase 43 family protein [Bacteroidota bacterium]